MARNQLFMAIPATDWERIFGKKKCRVCGGAGVFPSEPVVPGKEYYEIEVMNCHFCHGTGKQE